MDEGKTGHALKKALESIKTIDDCRDRVISYLKTEFLCVTFKAKGAEVGGRPNNNKERTQKLRAHHVRVGRYFNLLDFCRSDRAVEEGRKLVPKCAENEDGREYRPVPEEAAARSFAAALDPLVEQLGRISVVRGIETAGFSDDEHAELHRWDRDSPWRLVFVLPRGANSERACKLLTSCPHVQDVRSSRHASESYAVALVVDRRDYDEHRGLRPVYPIFLP